MLGLFAREDGKSENDANVHLSIDELMDESNRPPTERSAIQCLDLPVGIPNDLAAEWDTIAVMHRFQSTAPMDFVGSHWFGTFRFWCTANTAYCHSPPHIDANGAATASKILNAEGIKIWGVRSEHEDHAEWNIDGERYAIHSDEKDAVYDFAGVEGGDEM